MDETEDRHIGDDLPFVSVIGFERFKDKTFFLLLY